MTEQINGWWAESPWLVATLAAGAALVAVLAVTLVIRLVAKTARAVRGAAPNLKLAIGQALVQAGVTWAVVTGTYEFCTKVFKLPEWEAGAFAVFLEAATWVTVGMIYDHGKGKDKHGKANVGFGPAGPFFWLFSVLGGVLAVIAGASFGAMVGRAVIVVFGACLWYLALLRVTRRSGQRTRFRWTPRRLFVALGALEPESQDVADEHEEWQIRRMARAMRWANSRWPWSWLGNRALTSRAEQTKEKVIEAARRRYAVAHVVVSSVRPDSEVMRRIIEDVKRGPMAPVSNELRTELDEIRMGTRQVTTELRAQVDQLRTIDGIRMPASIADQIPDQIPADWIARHRTRPVDEPGPDRAVRVDQGPAGDMDHPRTSEVDQTPGQTGPRDLVHVRTTPVDQVVTSGSVPATRTTAARRTTVRVDQIKPVSPAAGGTVPPRVEPMVQALREAYPGAIPGRRTVMDQMGWTSAGDTQRAINLVRAERTKTTTKES
ncbi:hypothetical protein ABZ793_06285 [Micromonospora sp. NPDC047465]|uniref:hypothetical protein n=1 Tax=Micromonospora sp. NPDC047465 TaxID=3154813 RepID=UPI003409AE0D